MTQVLKKCVAFWFVFLHGSNLICFLFFGKGKLKKRILGNYFARNDFRSKVVRRDAWIVSSKFKFRAIRNIFAFKRNLNGSAQNLPFGKFDWGIMTFRTNASVEVKCFFHGSNLIFFYSLSTISLQEIGKRVSRFFAWQASIASQPASPLLLASTSTA